MSDLLQAGQHPDADQLNGFVEHALPAHEREQTLAHLATCSDCRQIVALSLPPTEEPAVVEPEPELAPRYSGWFSGWRLAWIAPPALAAVVMLTTYLRGRPNWARTAVGPTQIAESHPPALPPPAPQKREQLATKASPALHSSAFGGPAKARSASPAGAESTPVNGRDFAAMKQSAAPGQAIGGPVLAYSKMAGIASGPGAAPTHPASSAFSGSFKRPLPATVPSRFTDAMLPPAGSVDEARVSAPSEAMDGSNGPTVIATENTVGAGSASGSAVSLAATRPGSRGNAFRKNTVISIQAALPSGLPLLSFAAYLQQRIAIDTGNQLFFSEDAGQHWRSVPSPWRGRAIAVAATGVSRFAAAPAQTEPMAFAVPERFTPGEGAVAESGTPSDSLTGTITDAAGAVIPRATITMTDSRTDSIRTVETDGGGRYVVTDFVPGLYRVEVRAPGFLRQSLLVDLTSSPQVVRNIVLDVGQASETVSVEAATMSLDTESRSISPSAAAKTKRSRSRVLEGQPTQPAIFIITTDGGERWTSSDGQNWKQE